MPPSGKSRGFGQFSLLLILEFLIEVFAALEIKRKTDRRRERQRDVDRNRDTETQTQRDRETERQRGIQTRKLWIW